MSKYTPTIGLEIHAELKTRTKMFCNSKNDPDETRPNSNVCPVCMGHPGTLPVLNKEAIKHVLKVGVALDGKLADFTEWDRKNYFYPDIPKGYQISQYKYPLVSGGKLNGFEITRIHLEEDTARNIHTDGDYSLVDFNRAGIPLMELVTEPVIHSGQDAANFAREFQLLLRYLGVADANMEKGEMRVEANISVSKDKKFGTKVEIKNLNSFKSVERGIEYEIKRQVEALEAGDKVVQETRGWDENKQETFSQRKKETSEDYRYFPEPDLPKLKLSEIPEFEEKKLRKELPELPWKKRESYIKLGLKKEDAEVLLRIEYLGNFFHEVSKEVKGDSDLEAIRLIANYIISDISGLVNAPIHGDISNVTPLRFIKVIKWVKEGTISSRVAKDLLQKIYARNVDPDKIVKQEGLLQKSDEGELKKIAEKIISENSKAVGEYKGGKEASLQFLVGQGMQATKGSANPQVLAQLFKKLLQ